MFLIIQIATGVLLGFLILAALDYIVLGIGKSFGLLFRGLKHIAFALVFLSIYFSLLASAFLIPELFKGAAIGVPYILSSASIAIIVISLIIGIKHCRYVSGKEWVGVLTVFLILLFAVNSAFINHLRYGGPIAEAKGGFVFLSILAGCALYGVKVIKTRIKNNEPQRLWAD